VYLDDTVLRVSQPGNDVILVPGLLSGTAEPYLRAHTTGNDVYLHRQRYDFPLAVSGFPTQFAGLRYFHGTVKELCLVATADAPIPVWRVSKGGTTYAVYLVDTSDPNASTVRVKTAAGTKSARLKT
jgi:hypothetical protein